MKSRGKPRTPEQLAGFAVKRASYYSKKSHVFFNGKLVRGNVNPKGRAMLLTEFARRAIPDKVIADIFAHNITKGLNMMVSSRKIAEYALRRYGRENPAIAIKFLETLKGSLIVGNDLGAHASLIIKLARGIASTKGNLDAKQKKRLSEYLGHMSFYSFSTLYRSLEQSINFIQSGQVNLPPKKVKE